MSQVSEKWWTLVLIAYVSLVASSTPLQWLVACLDLILDSEDLFCCYKQRNDFYGLPMAAEHK